MELILAICSIFFWEVLNTLISEGALIFIFVLFFLHIFGGKKLVFPKECFFILLLVLHFILCCFIGTANEVSFIKQFLGIVLSMLYYYNVLYCNELKNVMLKYCNIAFLFSCYGILQEILGLFRIDVLVNLKWLVANMKNEKVLNMFQRCVGLCMEPFNFAMLLLPAVYMAVVAIYEKKDTYYTKIKSIIVILAYIFTFSSAGYLGLFVAIGLIAIKGLQNQKLLVKDVMRVIIGIIIILVLFAAAYCFIPEFTMRVDDTIIAITSETGLSEVNLSSYALISSLLISFNMFCSTKGMGVGLGSYGVNYIKYSTMLDDSSQMYGINSEDANSMMFRLIAEIGIFTLIILFYLIKCRRMTDLKNRDISNAMLSVIIIKFLRSGNYMFAGTMFFFCMYFLCARQERNIKNEVFHSDYYL